MHLCVVTGTHHPETSGPATYLSHLLPELLQRGHTLDVITYTDAATSNWDTGYPYPVFRISRSRSIAVRLFAMTSAVVRIGRKADVIFVSDYGLPAALANLFLRKPIVLKSVSDFAWEFSTRHGWLPTRVTIDEFQQRQNSMRISILQWLQKMYAGAAHLIIAPSAYSASLITGWGIDARRVKIIYNALELSAFAYLPSREDSRTELGFGKEPVLIAVGRLVKWKRFDGIIAALYQIRAKFPAARLVVIGDGPESETLQRTAQSLGEAVQFTGSLPPDQVYLNLRAADLYVQFSTYEGLPHTALEAMAAGTPVVISQVGGNVEVVAHGQSGLLVPPGDIQALAGAITQLLTQPDAAKNLARQASKNLERFSWPILVEKTEAALKEVIA